MIGDRSKSSVADSVTSTELKNEPPVGLAETVGAMISPIASNMNAVMVVSSIIVINLD